MIEAAYPNRPSAATRGGDRIPAWQLYALSALVSLLALGLTLLLPASDRYPSFMFFLLATALVAATGEWKAALLTVIEATILAAYFVLPPRGFAVASPEHRLRLAIFVACGAVVSFVVPRAMTWASSARRSAAVTAPARPAGVHASATIDPSAVLGNEITVLEKAVISAGARISDRATIGRSAAVGTAAVVGESARIGDHCRLGNHVIIGRAADIGEAAVIAAGVRVGPGAQVPPGAAVTANVPSPARKSTFL